jgi:hypothetical protein
MKAEPMLCKQANQIDLVDYLLSLGHHPQKIRGNDYWYLSPLRQERTASFKVNRKLNCWYDHGTGKGGNLVDFGILYHNVSVKQLLDRLQHYQAIPFSFHQLFIHEQQQSQKPVGKIQIISIGKITNPGLLEYLEQRKIPAAIANQFCSEIFFELHNKKQLAIGFKNEHGGYELRSQHFKGSSAPKESRLIRNESSNSLAVFEGFFDFLSFQTLQKTSPQNLPGLTGMQSDFLILNSLSFFENQRQTMDHYRSIHLLLDRDRRGMEAMELASRWSDKYKDQSHIYKNYKDLNEWLIKSEKQQIKQSQRRGLGL